MTDNNVCRSSRLDSLVKLNETTFLGSFCSVQVLYRYFHSPPALALLTVYYYYYIKPSNSRRHPCQSGVRKITIG